MEFEIELMESAISVAEDFSSAVEAENSVISCHRIRIDLPVD